MTDLTDPGPGSPQPPMPSEGSADLAACDLGGPSGPGSRQSQGVATLHPEKRRLTLAVAIGIALASLGFAGGVLATRTPPEATPVASQTADLGNEPVERVAQILLPSVVEIRSGLGGGSGVIYKPNGYILTAAHVVGQNETVTIRLADGTRLEGKVLGRDTGRDIAVVKVNRNRLRAARIARGQPRIGQLAVAIGSPFGLRDSVTAGVISGVGRTLPTGEAIVDAIQTDAPVNPGNSGGPLADRLGRVIGINVAVRGNGDSVAFAVPIDVAMETVQRLEKGQDPAPVAYLGVTGTDPSTGPGGALVTDVPADTPAGKVGIKPGDLITAIDGKRVTSMSELASEIRKRSPGDKVVLSFTRGETPHKATVVLGERSG